MWQIILLTISTIMFFGFVAINLIKFGLLDCYSAYGMLWQKQPHEINWWSAITILSALLMIPVLLENSDNSIWQFTGFLAPMSLVLVGATPQYNIEKAAWWLHQLGAWLAVVFVVLYMVFIGKSFIWMVIFVTIAGGLTIWKSTHWMLWFEIAVYACIYAVLLTL